MSEIKDIRIEEYNYPLPDERIAKHPLEQRDECKLLVRNAPRATEQCKKEEPPICQPEGDRMVRCWLYAKEDKEVSE